MNSDMDQGYGDGNGEKGIDLEYVLEVEIVMRIDWLLEVRGRIRNFQVCSVTG